MAYAAATGNDARDALIRDAAQRLNVSPGRAEIGARAARSATSSTRPCKDGRLTQQQADRMKQMIREHGLPLGGPGPGFGPGPMGGPGHGPFGPGLDAAADYLGLTRAELARRLMNGRSLAEVARARGKSVDGLEQALVDAARSDLDRAVADGKLTAAQRDEILSRLREHVDELVAGTGPGPRFRHGGPGGPGGPPPFGGPDGP